MPVPRSSLLPTAAAVAVAVLAGLLGASWATAASGAGADAVRPARPCSKTHRLAKRTLSTKIDGRRKVLGHLYVYDEGRNLCALTTSAGTRWHGVDKYMKATLSTGDAERTGEGRFPHQTGAVRLHDAHHGFVAMGIIRLDSGEQAGAVASGKTASAAAS
jgi:hypothetical protein